MLIPIPHHAYSLGRLLVNSPITPNMMPNIGFFIKKKWGKVSVFNNNAALRIASENSPHTNERMPASPTNLLNVDFFFISSSIALPPLL